MSRARTLPALLLAASCFSDPPKIEPDDDPIGTCRQCEQQKCPSYYQICTQDPDCNACIDAPIDLGCLSPMLDAFRGLASCSCDNCATECGYMCPGPPGGCGDCRFGAPCSTERTACNDDVSCRSCLQDPFDEGCQTNASAQALEACVCQACGPRCIWECEAAVGECTDCFIGGICGPQFMECMGDETEVCGACFANNALEGCTDNALLDALSQCVCDSCPQCGPLFTCGG